jgi:hypothetical protein
MKVWGKVPSGLLVLVLIAALGVGAYFAVKRFMALFMRLDFQVAMATATVTGAVLLAAIIIAVSIRRAAVQRKNSELRSEKAEAYSQFIDLWEELLGSGHFSESVEELAEEIHDVHRFLLLYGCAELVKAHNIMQTLGPAQARTHFAFALLEIRKDLGVMSWNLTSQEMAQVLASEIDNPPSWSRRGTGVVRPK